MPNNQGVFSLSKQKNWPIIVLLGVVLMLAAGLRLHGLTSRTIGHNEIYTPGIELPLGLSTPRPRLTVYYTLSSLLHENEPHPPGYYLLMLGWTRIFGSAIFAFRLPSVIAGVLSVFLVFMIGYLELDKKTAVVAAALLAVNGYHILWSQIAKNYVISCFFGLLATFVLILAIKATKHQLLVLILYVATVLAGMSMTIWFWPVFITHIIWVLIRRSTQPSLPGLVQWQMLALVLGSPFLALAVFQANQDSYLSREFVEITRGLGQFVGFGFLFEPDDYGPAALIAIPALAGTVLALLGLGLLLVGLYSDRGFEQSRKITRVPPQSIMILSSIASFMLILLFAVVTPYVYHNQDAGWTGPVYISSVIPWIMLAAYFLMRRYWSGLQRLSNRINWTMFPGALSAYLAIVPVAIILLITLKTPLFTARGALLYVPFALIISARGLISLVQTNKYWLLVILVLVVAYPVSLLNYKYGRHEEPIDYKALAEAWLPRVQANDLIFVRGYDSMETPIFYYLDPSQFNVVGYDYSQRLSENPEARVWLLKFEMDMRPQMKEALKDHTLCDTVKVFGAGAYLYGNPCRAGQEKSVTRTE